MEKIAKHQEKERNELFRATAAKKGIIEIIDALRTLENDINNREQDES